MHSMPLTNRDSNCSCLSTMLPKDHSVPQLSCRWSTLTQLNQRSSKSLTRPWYLHLKAPATQLTGPVSKAKLTSSSCRTGVVSVQMRTRPRMRNTPTVFVRPPSNYMPMAQGILIDWTVSWDAWSVGATDKTEDSDHAWVSAVGNKAYMMPVSPWFYTNLPEYNKNWLWRGDDLWHIRWQQVLDIQPNFVEVGLTRIEWSALSYNLWFHIW